MNKFLSIPLILILASSSPVYAGGAAARKRNMGARMRQQQIIAQQQMIQKAVAERVIAEKIKVQQQAAVQVAARKAAQQAVQQKVASNAVRLKTEQQLRNRQFQGQIEISTSQTINVPVPPQVPVAEVATLQRIISSLEQSSRAWDLVIDRQAKEMIVDHYVRQYAGQKTYIRKPASHYVDLVDGMSQQNSEMLEVPFANVLRVVAVMEYDFDNGQNRDDMALKILGPQGFQQNKSRLQKNY